MANFTKAEKIKFTSRAYFGVSNNPRDDVNPFNDLQVFLNSKVNSLRWGAGGGTANRSKKRFASNMRRVMQTFDIRIDEDDVFQALKPSSKKNSQVVEDIVKDAVFPPKPDNN